MNKVMEVTPNATATVAAPSANDPALDPFGRVWALKQDLRQRDVAAWNRPYIAYFPRAALADEKQAALQAAIEAGWILSPICTWEDVTTADGQTRRRYLFDGVEVDDLLASEVAWYGTLVLAHFEDMTRIPKTLSSP